MREVDGPAFAVTFDFDAEEPVEFTKVSDLHIFRDLMLEGYDEQECGCGDGAVINMNNNNYGSMTVVTTMMVEHSLVHVTLNKP